MKDLAALQHRYQRDIPAVRLGGLASNLNRIAWCAEHDDQQQAHVVFRESKYFTEWAAPSCSFDQQVMLAELQLQLALWERGWARRFTPSAIATEAQRWSQQLLASSGLLT